MKEKTRNGNIGAGCWFARAGNTRWVLTTTVAPRDSACAAVITSKIIKHD